MELDELIKDVEIQMDKYETPLYERKDWVAILTHLKRLRALDNIGKE